MALGTVILPFDTGAYGQPTKTILAGILDGNGAPSTGFIAGDQFNLVLYPRAQGSAIGAPTVTSRLPTSTISVTGKLATAPGAGSVLFLADSFAESEDGDSNWLYTGVLNLNTTELLAAIGTGQSIQVMLVIEVGESDGDVQRFLAPIVIYNETYAGSEGAPSDATPGYSTTVQSLALFVQNLIAITGQTGGGASKIDGLSTTTGATPAVAGWKIEINDADSSRWRLDVGTGTDVNLANEKVVPVDYNAEIPLVWTRYA